MVWDYAESNIFARLFGQHPANVRVGGERCWKDSAQALWQLEQSAKLTQHNSYFPIPE